MNRIILPLVLILVLFAGAGYYFFYHQKIVAPTPLSQGQVCEPDSLVCSDGTVLQRQLPKCDFPPCPDSESTSSGAMQNYTPIPSASGEDITISGTTICLPHRNASGPQTMECALGFKGDDGNNYGLNDPGWKYLTSIGNDAKVKITGKITKKQDTKYDSVGVIEIQSLSKL